MPAGRHDAVALAEEDGIIQAQRTAAFARAGQSHDDIRHLHEAEPNRRVPEAIGDLLELRPVLSGDTRHLLEGEAQRQDVLVERTHLGHMV